MLSSYFIELHTCCDYTVETYDAAAGRLTHMLVALLSDRDSISALTHNAERESCHSELEVMLEEYVDGRELVAKIVVDIVGQAPIKHRSKNSQT